MITTDELTDAIRKLDPTQANELREIFNQPYWATKRPESRDQGDHVRVRILQDGAPITLDVAGAIADLNNKSLFDTLNFTTTGSAVRINALNKREAEIPMGGSTGSGADCMFDYLVSTCFASLAGFTEGEVFTSVSGCTFKGYSTVGGMVAQAFIDFGASNVSVAYICRGTYLETAINFGLNQYMRWLGSGRTRTIIGTTTLTTTNTCTLPTGARLQVSSLTLRASTNGSSTAGGIDIGGAGWLIAEDCVFRGRGVTTLDSTSWAIFGGGTAFIFLTDCELQRNGFLGNNESVAQFTHCFHSGGGVGIRALNNTQITGCFFNGSLVGASQLRSNCQVSDSHFEDCTTGITTVSGSTDWLTVDGNHYDNCTTAMDFSDGGVVQNYNWKITNNHGTNMGADVFIAWPVGYSTIYGICSGNMTDGGGTFSTGANPVGMRIGPNYENNGLARGDVIGAGLQGIVQNGVAADFKTVRWGSFVIFFGATKVIASPGSFTYSTNNTYYISVNSSGVVTANTLGGFPAASYPLAIATTNIVGTVTQFEWYDGYLRASASGAGPAGSDEPYVVYAPPANLPNARQYITVDTTIPGNIVRPVGSFWFDSVGDNLYVTPDGAGTWTVPMRFKIYTSLGETVVAGHSFP